MELEDDLVLVSPMLVLCVCECEEESLILNLYIASSHLLHFSLNIEKRWGQEIKDDKIDFT